MKNLAENLKYARKALDLTQSEVVDLIGKKYQADMERKVSRTMLSNWESGKQVPTVFYLRCLSEIYHVSMDELSGKNKLDVSSDAEEDTVKLPIAGEVSAGYGSYADVVNNAVDYDFVPESWVKKDGEYCLLRVKGDSMYPKFEQGDLLLVRCQPELNNNEFGIVLIDEENGVVKQYKRGHNYIELQSVNPMYAPRVFEGKDMNRIRIFGLVKKAIRNY